jgi:hypothetical protein
VVHGHLRAVPVSGRLAVGVGAARPIPLRAHIPEPVDFAFDTSVLLDE